MTYSLHIVVVIENGNANAQFIWLYKSSVWGLRGIFPICILLKCIWEEMLHVKCELFAIIWNLKEYVPHDIIAESSDKLK